MDVFNSWMKEVSYGKKSITSTVVGPFQASFNSCSGHDNVAEAVRLADSSLDYRQFNSVYVVMHDVCDGAFGSIGENAPFSTQDGKVQMGWTSGNAQELPDVWRYETHEYRDDFSAMGQTGLKPHYDAPHKNQLGFFDPANGGSEHVQDFTTPSVYHLSPLEDPAGITTTSQIKALRIPRGNGPNGPEYLWVEYRQAKGFDSSLDPSTLDGVFVHIENAIPGDNHLHTLMVDATPPGLTLNTGDPGLELGRSVYDPMSNITITLTTRSTTSASVRIAFGPPMSCVGPTHLAVGQHATFTVSGGSAPYRWTASFGASSTTGTGPSFNTSFSTKGTKLVRVISRTSSPTTAMCRLTVS
jgi:hypothetical protein